MLNIVVDIYRCLDAIVYLHVKHLFSNIVDLVPRVIKDWKTLVSRWRIVRPLNHVHECLGRVPELLIVCFDCVRQCVHSLFRLLVMSSVLGSIVSSYPLDQYKYV